MGKSFANGFYVVFALNSSPKFSEYPFSVRQNTTEHICYNKIKTGRSVCCPARKDNFPEHTVLSPTLFFERTD